jgi:hypothetical protein
MGVAFSQGPVGRKWKGIMKINLDSEDIARIVQALEHYHAYLRSQRRDDITYMQLAERLRLHK